MRTNVSHAAVTANSCTDLVLWVGNFFVHRSLREEGFLLVRKHTTSLICLLPTCSEIFISISVILEYTVHFLLSFGRVSRWPSTNRPKYVEPARKHHIVSLKLSPSFVGQYLGHLGRMFSKLTNGCDRR